MSLLAAVAGAGRQHGGRGQGGGGDSTDHVLLRGGTLVRETRGHHTAAADPGAGLAGHREVGAAVLRPGRLVVPGSSGRSLPNETTRRRSAATPEAHEVVAGGAGALLAEGEVVLDGAALVAVALDGHPHLAPALEPERVLLEGRPRLVGEGGAVVLEADVGERAALARARARRRRCRCPRRPRPPRRARRGPRRRAARGPARRCRPAPARPREWWRAPAGASCPRSAERATRTARVTTRPVSRRSKRNGMNPPRTGPVVTGPSRAGRCCPARWPASGASGPPGRRS